MNRPPLFQMGPNYQGGPPPFNYSHRPNFQFQAPFNCQRPNFRNRPPSPSYNSEHWCETCDRSFPTADLLKKHMQQHQKCNIDGCQFVAHPKVITKHIQMQHSSGLYKKIANLNNPEAINKWREERKKRYPTKVNIEIKAAERKEKIERGEKIGLRHDSNAKNFRTGVTKRKSNFMNRNSQQKRQGYNRNNSAVNQSKKPVLPKKPNDVLPTTDNGRRLKPFAGIQNIIMECTEDQPKEIETNLDIEDDDDYKLPNLIDPVQQANTQQKVCGALSSLMCNYESSEEEDDTSKKDHVTEQMDKSKLDPKHITAKVKLEESLTQHTCIDKSDDDSGPEETKVVKAIDTGPSNNNVGTIVENHTKKLLQNSVKPKRPIYRKPRAPSTLLQKLLCREIQQERNIVLQCIRYVVNNKFFDNA